jgi:fatty acid desaturase
VFNALFNIPLPNSPEHCSVYRFSRRERLRIAFETTIMVGYQVGLGMWFGSSDWIWMGLTPSLLGAFLGMFYINTQHHTRPLLETNDPIGSSASVKLPRFFEILHMNFGHHVEHHIFPGMDNHYYPLMTPDLKRLLGPEYNEVSFVEAYRIMFKSSPFKDPHKTKGVPPTGSTSVPNTVGPAMQLSS